MFFARPHEIPFSNRRSVPSAAWHPAGAAGAVAFFDAGAVACPLGALVLAVGALVLDLAVGALVLDDEVDELLVDDAVELELELGVAAVLTLDETELIVLAAADFESSLLHAVSDMAARPMPARASEVFM